MTNSDEIEKGLYQEAVNRVRQIIGAIGRGEAGSMEALLVQDEVTRIGQLPVDPGASARELTIFHRVNEIAQRPEVIRALAREEGVDPRQILRVEEMTRSARIEAHGSLRVEREKGLLSRAAHFLSALCGQKK